MLGVPRLVNDGSGGVTLTEPERAAQKRVMPVVPGGFDEDAPEMGVAGFGDRAARLFRAARVFGGDEAGKGHHPRCRGEAAGGAEVGGAGGGGGGGDAAARRGGR